MKCDNKANSEEICRETNALGHQCVFIENTKKQNKREESGVQLWKALMAFLSGLHDNDPLSSLTI